MRWCTFLSVISLLLSSFSIALNDGDYEDSEDEYNYEIESESSESDDKEYDADDEVDTISAKSYSQHDSYHRDDGSYDSDYYKPKKKKVYVPVFVPEKEKKKMKIINVDQGFHIEGGQQLFGKFKSLKKCMKACALTPNCLAGDFNPWLHKCYQHSNLTACNTQSSHPQFVHFSKVPCNVIDAPTGRVTLGANMANGIEQKGIDTLQQCIKKCAAAGLGIPATAVTPQSFNTQGCFAIDYDFATHRCYFFLVNVLLAADGTPVLLHCITANGVIQPSSLGLRPSASVVHITLCPLNTGA